ncbi:MULTISPECIES: hypothetical protein [Streptomycetaceae]|uniref:hypothetical protein n=1 Tax=Streptomycetaceae TaxID=2062 RepID=UPI000CDCA50C|nr:MULTISPECIES: hypothetical protein [Streptomycetaceae]AUY47942.1 hypothetical protein C2142_02005 [Streptomyces sp. CB01881]MBP0449279.1 hypothetical protein [Kitasatospora sp. RG8]TYC76418.1 hypothetical protein EH183_02005 [Streptomyces sp. CB01881]
MSRISDSDSMPTPDHLLHTGAEHPVDPEDMVRASGREPTPALIEKARQDLAKYGAAAVERLLP